MKAKPKKFFIILCLISMIGCTTTGQAYLPHTSRTFHAKKNCVGCYDPNPIVFQSVQHAASDSRIAPCSMCVKPKHYGSTNQGYTAINYAKSGSGTGGSNSQKLPPAKSKSSVVANVLSGILVTLGIVALAAASSAATPTQTYTPTPNFTVQPTYSGLNSGGYPSSNYNAPSSVFNTTTPSYSSPSSSYNTSSYVGGNSYRMAPDGTYVGGDSYRMAPDGTYVGGDSYRMAPDGTYVGGDSYRMAPDGTYVGSGN